MRNLKTGITYVFIGRARTINRNIVLPDLYEKEISTIKNISQRPMLPTCTG